MAAYNPYFPASYQPFGGYFQQPVMPQQMQVPQIQQQQGNPSPSGIIWVSGAQEAQMYPVAPNNAVALWENSGKVIYLKQADATGKPTMRIYDLVERTQSAQDASQPDGDKLPAFATKDELGAVVGVVKGFDEVLAALRADIETMKGDMYGIAGKKKATKKPVEVTEDE